MRETIVMFLDYPDELAKRQAFCLEAPQNRNGPTTFHKTATRALAYTGAIHNHNCHPDLRRFPEGSSGT
jgi:hypothetical protein